MAKRRYSVDGEPWVPVSQASKPLGTNAAGVRKLIEEGKLRSRLSRVGSSIVVVDLKQVADLRVAKQHWRREREKAKKVKAKPPATSHDLDRGTMSRFRARLRNQLELVPPAKDCGPPGRSGPPVRNS